MAQYMRTRQMMDGGSFYCSNGGAFMCPNCGGKQAENITGPSSLDLYCRWCHSQIKIRMKKYKSKNGAICKGEMIVSVRSVKEIDLTCPNCDSFVSVKMKEPASFAVGYIVANRDKKEFVERRE